MPPSSSNPVTVVLQATGALLAGLAPPRTKIDVATRPITTEDVIIEKVLLDGISEASANMRLSFGLIPRLENGNVEQPRYGQIMAKGRPE
jgi:hypothetical protein